MSIMSKNIRWLLPLHIILAVAVNVYLLMYVAGFNGNIAVTDAILSNIILFLSLWGIYLVVKAYPTPVAVMFYAILVSIFFSLVSGIIDWQILNWWLGAKEYRYATWLLHTLPLRIIILCIIYGWVATYTALRKRADDLEEKFLQQTDAALLLREAELFKLRQQLQPHFLYNSLNSISALIMIQPDKAQEMIGKLSDFLRSSVRRESEDHVKINDELEYIQSYLAIESVRFGDRLQVQFEKAYTDDATIPPFLLQPILENAIKFGLYGRTGAVTITMHIALQGPMLTVTVTNPYDAQTRPPRGTGFGLEGIQRRLYLLYSRTDLLELSKDGETFTTILKIPQAHVQSDTDR